MAAITFQPLMKPLQGIIRVPGDKSISHRAVMFGALAYGKTTVKGFLPGEDCLSTISCFRKMGVDIRQDDDMVTIAGNGASGLREPESVLDVGNSGTTARLLLGILAGLPFHSVLIGDESIAKRPMDRVTVPLKKMGAVIDGRGDGTFTPISVRGGLSKGIRYVSPVASAQVKSAVLLAGMLGEGKTTVVEPAFSRDHTERMLEAFGISVQKKALEASVIGGQSLTGRDIEVPGDVSSAAFFLAAGAIANGSELTLENVGMNPTRTGILDILKKMGADLTFENTRSYGAEPVADVTIKHSELEGIDIGGDMIPTLIDEIPVIALIATQVKGKTVIKDAAELKVKETNRIDTVVSQLKKLGADIEATDDGMVVNGGELLDGGEVDSFGDHRIGMMLAAASCVAKSEIVVKRAEAIAVSYPDFTKVFTKLSY
jgi:3-phosphoshikimate 1-carboxyvinyltransferase